MYISAWKQNGTLANSGAMFLAASKEKDVTQHHTIDTDGYDVGRDQLVSNALGTKSHGGVTYHTTATNVTGLLPVGTAGVNHGELNVYSVDFYVRGLTRRQVSLLTV